MTSSVKTSETRSEHLPFLSPSLHLPSHPTHALHLDNSPLCIIPSNTLSLPDKPLTSPNSLTPAIGIATILHNWHPNALLAFLDTQTWVTFTWLLTIGKEDKQIEIGRVRGRVTVGELDGGAGEWRWCVSWDMMMRRRKGGGVEDGAEDGEEDGAMGGKDAGEGQGFDDNEGGDATTGLLEGPWLINEKESIIPPTSSSSIECPSSPSSSSSSSPPSSSPEESHLLSTHALTQIQTWLRSSIWTTTTKSHHELFVESPALGVDAWGDGMKISPHWLYRPMELGRCTSCGRDPSVSEVRGGEVRGGEYGGSQDGEVVIKLRKCAKCGTAAYCSRACQMQDWKVHKGVCGMSLEERGKAMFYSSGEGGLAGASARMDPTLSRDGEEEEGGEEEEEEEDDDGDDEGGGWVYEGGSRSIEELKRMPPKLSERETRETVDMMEKMMREASMRR